jgi:hypothetical protein
MRLSGMLTPTRLAMTSGTDQQRDGAAVARDLCHHAAGYGQRITDIFFARRRVNTEGIL